MLGAVEVRTERDAFVGDFAQFAEAEYLKAARVGEDRSGPGHKFMQAAEFADEFVAGPQIQMISVGEQDLDAEVFEVLLGKAFDSGRGADWHERRSVDGTVRSAQATEPSTGRIRRENFKFE